MDGVRIDHDVMSSPSLPLELPSGSPAVSVSGPDRGNVSLLSDCSPGPLPPPLPVPVLPVSVPVTSSVSVSVTDPPLSSHASTPVPALSASTTAFLHAFNSSRRPSPPADNLHAVAFSSLSFGGSTAPVVPTATEPALAHNHHATATPAATATATAPPASTTRVPVVSVPTAFSSPPRPPQPLSASSSSSSSSRAASAHHSHVLVDALTQEKDMRLAAERRVADVTSRMGEQVAALEVQVADEAVKCRRAEAALRQLASSHSFAHVIDAYDAEVAVSHQELLLLRARNMQLEDALADANSGSGGGGGGGGIGVADKTSSSSRSDVGGGGGPGRSAPPSPPSDKELDSLLADIRGDAGAGGGRGGGVSSDDGDGPVPRQPPRPTSPYTQWAHGLDQSRHRRDLGLLQRKAKRQAVELTQLRNEVLSLRQSACRVGLYKRCLDDASAKLRAMSHAVDANADQRQQLSALNARLKEVLAESSATRAQLDTVTQERDGLVAEVNDLRRHVAQVHEEQRRGAVLSAVTNHHASRAVEASAKPAPAAVCKRRKHLQHSEREAKRLLDVLHREASVACSRLVPTVTHVQELVAALVTDRADGLQRESDLIDTLTELVAKRNDASDIAQVRRLHRQMMRSGGS